MKEKVGPKKGRRVIVLGAGFGGLEFCKKFSIEEVEIIVIDRQNHHLFQPLLYQVASAGLSAPEIAQPIRQIFSGRMDISIVLDEVLAINLNERKVRLRESDSELTYDYLIIALGAQTNYFGNDSWSVHSHGLKTLDDATRIRHRVLLAFEKAEYAGNDSIRERLMTIVVIGGGPTGVELAGAFAELVRHVFKRDFRHIDLSKARIILIEAAPRILLSFPERLARRGRDQLEKLGVEIRTGAKVNEIRKGEVVLENEIIEAENIIWSAGVCANPITRELNVEKDKSGRIKVSADLSLPGFSNVFAVGDIAALVDANGRSVPGVSPAAMQMATYVAKVLKLELKAPAGHSPPRPPFIYWDKGSMATIGRSAAVAKIGRLEISGLLAWLSWLFVHLIFLIGFRNKLAVLLQWFYSYINYKRGARIITGLNRDD